MKKLIAVTAAFLAVFGLAACGTTNAVTDSQTSNAPEIQTTITVFAASSLTETFTELGKQFEAANPGTTVTFSFAASSTLAEQIIAGAPADIFASASKKSMDAALTQVPASTVFTSNRVVLAFPANKPLLAISDLNDSTIKWVQCDHQVPCGAAADAALADEGITGIPVSLEPDVKSVTAKLTALEVDAAVIYATDVKSAGANFRAIEFSDAEKATTKYSIGVTLTANAKAQAFMDFILSEAGQKVLADAGFGPMN